MTDIAMRASDASTAACLPPVVDLLVSGILLFLIFPLISFAIRNYLIVSIRSNRVRRRQSRQVFRQQRTSQSVISRLLSIRGRLRFHLYSFLYNIFNLYQITPAHIALNSIWIFVLSLSFVICSTFPQGRPSSNLFLSSRNTLKKGASGTLASNPIVSSSLSFPLPSMGGR